MKNLHDKLAAVWTGAEVGLMILELLPQNDLICELREILEAQCEIMDHLYEPNCCALYEEKCIMEFLDHLSRLESNVFYLLTLKQSATNENV